MRLLLLVPAVLGRKLIARKWAHRKHRDGWLGRTNSQPDLQCFERNFPIRSSGEEPRLNYQCFNRLTQLRIFPAASQRRQLHRNLR